MFIIKRVLGYILGFILFYAPFALFQKALSYLLQDQRSYNTIHSLCFRIPIEHILDGRIFKGLTISTVSTFILLLCAIVFGTVFCGKLCPAGAFTEFLSKIIPERFQISWRKYTEIAPIRYGMLAGFCLVPFIDGILACAYCNFWIFDLVINYYTRGYFIALTSSMILTAIFWLFIFGIFTKGGRGFCNFLCPVGAIQNLVGLPAWNLPFAFRMRVNNKKCLGCGKCVRVCPMEAMSVENNKACINKNNCITCGVCANICSSKAIKYGRRQNEE